MPVYVYEVIGSDGSEGEVFEVLQKMSDPPLEFHPETGEAVRRIPTAAAMAGRWSDMKMSGRLSDKNLESKGFTKYVKTDDGRYEKSVGSGPDKIG